MSEPTKGPWKASPWKVSPCSSIVGSLVTSGGQNIAAVIPRLDKAETEANAALIASAPDLQARLSRYKTAMREAQAVLEVPLLKNETFTNNFYAVEARSKTAVKILRAALSDQAIPTEFKLPQTCEVHVEPDSQCGKLAVSRVETTVAILMCQDHVDAQREYKWQARNLPPRVVE